jgi:hypothetical protein
MFEATHAVLQGLFRLQRRFDPFVRPILRPLFKGPLTRLVQASINLTRDRDVPPLGQERIDPKDEQLTSAIVADMCAHLARDFVPGKVERAGQTKTYGVVAATLTVLEDIPERLRVGVFAEPRTFDAWVRFSNPGPHLDADIDDVGVASIGIKLLGVDGDKLIDEERATQDFTAISTPMFVSRNLAANVALQHWSRRHLGLYYFLNPRASHLRELVMQGLWAEVLRNPLGQAYYSCVPYRHGPERAVQYAFHPQGKVAGKVPRLPLRPPDDYLAQNMAASLATGPAEFTMTVQEQADPFHTPIEDAAVIWPERLAPHIPVARLTIPPQDFQTPERLALDRRMRINPWHSLEAHRPLGNQNRGRLRIYRELAVYRQAKNGEPHVEPGPDPVLHSTMT